MLFDHNSSSKAFRLRRNFLGFMALGLRAEFRTQFNLGNVHTVMAWCVILIAKQRFGDSWINQMPNASSNCALAGCGSTCGC